MIIHKFSMLADTDQTLFLCADKKFHVILITFYVYLIVRKEIKLKWLGKRSPEYNWSNGDTKKKMVRYF